MHLGITRTADAEARAAPPELPDQIDSVVIVPVGAILADHFGREIAAQSHDVLYPGGLDLGYLLSYRLFCGRHTGEMSQCRHTVIIVNILGYIQSVFAGAAASAVCNAHE